MSQTTEQQDAAREKHETAQRSAGEEITRLQEDLRRAQDQYLRTLADFDNYRKRVERDRERTAQAGKREVIVGLLDIVDDFERALQYVSDDDGGIAEGIRAIHRRLLQLLKDQGVTSYGSVGMPFDPVYHEALGSVATVDHPAGLVAEELRPGYRWGEDVLRPARVRVSA